MNQKLSSFSGSPLIIHGKLYSTSHNEAQEAIPVQFTRNKKITGD
jgi:hypothetical protein